MCIADQVWVKLLPGVLSGDDVKQMPPRSCRELLAEDQTRKTGWYRIPSPSKPHLWLDVWCDMVTDAKLHGGAGYTLVPVTSGKSVSRADEENSCTAMGLQLLVWRSKAHQVATLKGDWQKDGDVFSYFRAVPGNPLGPSFQAFKLMIRALAIGIYGVSAGSFTNVPMNSNSSAATTFKAIDGGSWFISDQPRPNAPNGDYSPGCLLGVSADQQSWATLNELNFDDKWCEYSTGETAPVIRRKIIV